MSSKPVNAKYSNKDLDLKMVTSRIFRSMGYSTWVEVTFFSHSYVARYHRTSVTDLDVLGIAFEGDLSPRTLGAECKSPETRGAEDTLKLLGALKLFGATRGYLVKTDIADNAREVAAHHGLVCLDETEAIKLLEALEPGGSKRLDAERVAHTTLNDLIGSLKRIEGYSKAIRYVSQDYWTRQPWENVQTLFFLALNGVGSQLDPHDRAHRVLFLELSRVFSVAILRLCHSVVSSRLGSIQREVEVQLFGGARARRDRERLFDELAKAHSGSLKGSDPLNPAFLAPLTEVVNYCLQSPLAATHIPLLLQRVIIERYLGIPDVFDIPIDAQFSDVTKKLAKDIAELFCLGPLPKSKEAIDELLRL